MSSSARSLACAALCLAGVVASARATTYTVINTNDTGAGSLRDAITQANTNAGADIIHFNIPGSGVQTILPAAGSPLPTITDTVTIDGYSQTGAVANTNGPGLGPNGTLLIELSGANGVSTGLRITADNVTIKGLVINQFSQYDIFVPTFITVANLTIQGNYIGTNAAGTASFAAKDFFAVYINGSSNAIVGGTSPSQRNLIHGNDTGVWFGDDANTTATVQGNLIGPNAAGTASIGTTGVGMRLRSISNSTIGGTTAAARNVISGMAGGINNGESGGSVGVSNVAIQGNWIGTDVTGTKVIGNTGHAIAIDGINAHIGGAVSGAGNVIAGSGSSGIYIYPASNGALIQGNFIGTDVTETLDLGNGSYGIDAESDDCQIGGPTPPEANNVIAFNGSAGSSAGVSIVGQRVRVRGNRIFNT